MTNITQQIAQHITQALQEILSDFTVTAQEVQLEVPTIAAHGDWASNTALVVFGQLADETKQQVQNPRHLAEMIAQRLKKSELISTGYIDEITVAGPGFINFSLSQRYFFASLQQLHGSTTLSGQVAHPAKYVVEYSSANIAKPFTIGHLRSTIIGAAVANVLEDAGHQVFRDNHLGDWGTQFGKQIYAIKTWGDEAKISQAERPVKELVNLYVKFHQEAEVKPEIEEDGRAWFKKLEDGDPEARRLWQMCIDWSLKEFNQIYQRLGVTFTENDGQGYGESYFEDKMGPVIAELEEKGLLTESKGAKLVFFPDDMYPPAMIVKKDGATLYATRDLATDKFRLEKYGPDVTIINEVGAEQELYFKQLFKIEEMLGWVEPGQRIHIKHGLYRFKDTKMSTRKGNVIWLEEVLQEAFDRVAAKAKDLDEATIWKIAIGALKWNDLKRKSDHNIMFDWDEITQLEGNSGPYIQYTYTRCRSVLAKSSDTLPQILEEYQLSDQETALVAHLSKYESMIEKTRNELSLHHLATWLFELAQLYNSFYTHQQILKEPESAIRQGRLALTTHTAKVLEHGLAIMGIEVPEKM